MTMLLDRPVKVTGPFTISPAFDARPSVALEKYAQDIVDLADGYGIYDIRVFGSSVTGTDTQDSDINLLAKVRPNRGYFEIGAFVGRVEEMTGYPVDFVIDDARRPGYVDGVETALL